MEGNIRAIGLDKVEESLRLSQFAFQYELSEAELAERIASFKPGLSWGYYIEDQLAAKLIILKLQTWINGRSFDMGGIASVATWPEFRRHGMVKKLLIHALQTMKEAGQTVSFLHPFEFPFYRKYGWETYIEHKKYEIPKDLIIKQFTSLGQMKQTNDWKLLDPIYQAYAQQFNGTLIRDEAWWTKNRGNKSAAFAIYYDESNVAKGYIQYKVKNKEMNVDELVFLDESARRGLWKFIADHDSMMEKVIVKAPIDDQLAFLLTNPRIKQEIVPYFMARIVDLVAFIEKLPMTTGLEKQKLELQITDSFAPWNNGTFAVKWNTSGKAKVKQVEASLTKETKGSPSILACDIGTLSAMLLGYQRPTLLKTIGRLQATNEAVEILEQLIPRNTTYLMDFF
ncbi:GNAT family N-acetyltransferase [Paenibacillus psychroresistens]|uniref:GNAT family N-acetyltransferase n=2 Tax=Paenibacillus psychroresistens TaxID=1778678 RepID=A0A6B8RW96_9BACL|nr:GNAT family N-acetyltransferase [Paenibacillus psychroresistens]